MGDTTFISLGFLIKSRAYREAMVYAMQSRQRFMVCDQQSVLNDHYKCNFQNTDVLICDDQIDCLIGFFHSLKDHNNIPHIILLVHSLNNQHMDEYLSSGIRGFISYNDGLDKLEECITEVHAGRLYYPCEITQRILNTLSNQYSYQTHIREDSVNLTPRQDSIIKLMESGSSNKDIARKLGIEIATVKNHVHVILNKLNAKNRSEAVALYRRSYGA